VAEAPGAGSFHARSFGFRGAFGSRTRPKPGTTIDVDNLSSRGLGTLSSASVTSVARLRNVAAASGSLTLTDTRITGKIPSFSSSGGGFGRGGGGGGGGGTFHGSFTPSTFTVAGVSVTKGVLGPLSSGSLTAGRPFTAADASSDVAVVDSDYAKQQKLSAGSSITIAKKSFKVVGIVSVPAGSQSSDVYIPLARAQALASMKNDVNTIYVA